MADTTITSGTVAQSGTRLYVMGSASGLDTSALVDAAYAQKTARADTIDLSITANKAEVEAYKTLQELGNALTESLDTLKATYGYSTTDNSVYSQLTSYLTTSGTTDVSSVLSASIDDTAEQGSYSLEVSRLAQAEKVTSDNIADRTAALGLTGTFSLSLGDAASVDINVTSTMSLQDVAKAINNASASTGVKATVINTSDASFSLVLTGTSTGESINFLQAAGDDVMQSIGMTDTSGAFRNVVQESQTAQIVLDGVTVTSKTNTISNVLDGVSFTLYKADPGVSMALEVGHNYSDTKTAITDFVDAYNNLRDFIIQNQVVSTDGTVSDDAVLFGDSALVAMSSQVSDILASTFGNDSAITNLADIGIEFDDDNKLTITDEDKLNTALLDSYESIQALFQTSTSIDNDNLALIRNTSSIDSLNATFNITMDASGGIASVDVDGDTSLFDVSGTRITGKAGTVYAGLTFAYVGTESTSITVNITQGLADRLYNAVDGYTNTVTGTVQTTISNIEDTNTQLDTEAARIRERADSFREKEVERYARMETDISAAKTLLKTIQALLGTNNSDS